MNKKNSISGSIIEMGIAFAVGDDEYLLVGSFADNKFSFVYSKPIEDAIDLGTITEGLYALGKALLGEKNAGELYKKIAASISQWPEPFKEVSIAFFTSHVVITRLELIIEKGKEMRYALGLGLVFKGNEKISIMGIALEYFTFEYEGTSGKKLAVNPARTPALH